MLAVSLLVSRRLARWAIEPLRELNGRAHELGSGGLHVPRTPTPVRRKSSPSRSHSTRWRTGSTTSVRSQRRFVADASHQLRTPLTALRLRLENLETEDPAAFATTRDAALLETSRLTRLVDGLLAFARAEGRRLDRQAVDVSAIVNQRQVAWAPLAAEHGIDLRVEPHSATSAAAIIVPGHLDQILDNLIDNALDATPPGHVVRERHERRATVEIHVPDEGRGMTDDDRERAFDPFWQKAEGSRTEASVSVSRSSTSSSAPAAEPWSCNPRPVAESTQQSDSPVRATRATGIRTRNKREGAQVGEASSFTGRSRLSCACRVTLGANVLVPEPDNRGRAEDCEVRELDDDAGDHVVRVGVLREHRLPRSEIVGREPISELAELRDGVEDFGNDVHADGRADRAHGCIGQGGEQRPEGQEHGEPEGDVAGRDNRTRVMSAPALSRMLTIVPKSPRLPTDGTVTGCEPNRMTPAMSTATVTTMVHTQIITPATRAFRDEEPTARTGRMSR